MRTPLYTNKIGTNGCSTSSLLCGTVLNIPDWVGEVYRISIFKLFEYCKTVYNIVYVDTVPIRDENPKTKVFGRCRPFNTLVLIKLFLIYRKEIALVDNLYYSK